MNKNIKFTLQYIYRCLHPEKQDYNVIIIDEAIILGEDITKSIQEKERRVMKLRKMI